MYNQQLFSKNTEQYVENWRIPLPLSHNKPHQHVHVHVHQHEQPQHEQHQQPQHQQLHKHEQYHQHHQHPQSQLRTNSKFLFVNSFGVLIYSCNCDKSCGKCCILLVKGKKSLKWGPPKGHHIPNIDKSIEETAIREVKEETGLTITIENNKYIKQDKLVVFEKTIDYVDNFIIEDKNEIAECKWIKLSELPEQNLISSMKHMISKNRLKI